MGNVAVRLKELLREKANQLAVDIEALEIMPDHVHPFVSSDPTKAPQYLVNQFKWEFETLSEGVQVTFTSD